jgi:hypothetical protein
MLDRTGFGRILDLIGPLILLVAAGAAFVYAITIATTLQDLRAREPISLPGHLDLEAWPCPSATGLPGSRHVPDGEPFRSSSGALPYPAATAARSTNCPPNAR